MEYYIEINSENDYFLLDDFINNKINQVYTDKNLWKYIEKLKTSIINNWISNYWIQIVRDGLLWSFRKLEFIFNKINKTSNIDEQELYLVSFFHYYKSLLEIYKKNFKNIEIKDELYKEITDIRNYFCHAYEKNKNKNKVFVRLDINNNIWVLFKDNLWNESMFYWLFRLELFNFDNKKRIWKIYFSLEKIYFELFNLIEKII